LIQTASGNPAEARERWRRNKADWRARNRKTKAPAAATTTTEA
jgi:hypothetical protein